jgi:hypothetical protein
MARDAVEAKDERRGPEADHCEPASPEVADNDGTAGDAVHLGEQSFRILILEMVQQL